MRVIGFGAHPDDVEIFFLGFLLCCQANGHDIGWVVATDGSQGLEDEYATLSAIDLAAIRQREAKAAAKQVGVQPVLLNLPDASLKPDAELAEIVAEQISALSPDLMVTHAASGSILTLESCGGFPRGPVHANVGHAPWCLDDADRCGS